MKIFYNGIGANKSGEHTEEEFLAIMNRELTHKDWDPVLLVIPREFHYQLYFKDWYLPQDFIHFTLADWIEYSGAEIVD